MALLRRDEFEGGALRRRVELLREGGVPRVKEYDGDLALQNDRLATVEEDERLATAEDEETTENGRSRVRQAYSALQAWAADEAQKNTDWPTLTNAQKDAANRELHRRFGLVCDRLSDLLRHLALHQ